MGAGVRRARGRVGFILILAYTARSQALPSAAGSTSSFLATTPGSTIRGSTDEAVRWGVGYPRLDASPFIAILSQHTKHVGFGLTYSSTYLPPYYIARLLNSLDHITNGRIAFNVVASTSRGGAANYGFDELMEHNSRYDRMEEFIDICKALWASAEQDAFIWDRESGIVADPRKVREINHEGRFFKVKGPLQCAPSPQGRPMLIEAGGSPRGINASAYFADYIFGAGKPLPEGQTSQATRCGANVEGTRSEPGGNIVGHHCGH
jgi:long-chain alkane monooxygenase